MSDFLPEVIMDEAIQDSEEEDITDREVVKVDREVVKSAIVEGDIFVDKTREASTSEIVVIKEVIEEKTPPTPPPSPKKVKEVKTRKKRVMTEEHKAKLALAREKALAKRRENAARKKEIKQLHKEEEEQKFQQLKHRVRPNKTAKEEEVMESSGVIEEEVKKELKKTNKNYTQEDLDNAVLNGIMKYEVIRKDRKKKKQEVKELSKHEESVRQQVRQIINKPVEDYNYFDNCY
tara:strand:- start:83 stop:784 length:702 start_codon:yes stop_codon:yes gene_type:complete